MLAVVDTQAWSIALIIAVAAAAAVYFLPTFIGRNKKNALAIFLLNLFAGWTFLGWLVALIWAATKDEEGRF